MTTFEGKRLQMWYQRLVNMLKEYHEQGQKLPFGDFIDEAAARTHAQKAWITEFLWRMRSRGGVEFDGADFLVVVHSTEIETPPVTRIGKIVSPQIEPIVDCWAA